MSCTIYPTHNDNALPSFISQFLDYSAPMVNRVEIEFEWEHLKPDQPFILNVANGWLPIDKILSGPKYPSLSTLNLIFSSKPARPPSMTTTKGVNTTDKSELNELRSEVQSSLVHDFVKKNLPTVSSCSHIEVKVLSSNLSTQHTLT